MRHTILEVSPEIREAIKWNAPSFRTTALFATFNLRSRDRVQLIFHTGAKVKDTATKGIAIPDPDQLLRSRPVNRTGAGAPAEPESARVDASARDASSPGKGPSRPNVRTVTASNFLP